MFSKWLRLTVRGSACATRRFLRDSRAVTGSEYAFMLALIIMSAVGAISLFSDAARTIHEEITTTLTNAVDMHL